MDSSGHSTAASGGDKGPRSAPKRIPSAQAGSSERTLRRVITTGLIAFVVWLFIALGQAHCADVARPAALYVSLSAADLGSTALAIGNGADEGNPFVRDHAIAKHLAVAGVLTFVDVKLQKRGKGVKTFRGVVTVIRVAAVVINIHNAKRGNR